MRATVLDKDIAGWDLNWMADVLRAYGPLTRIACGCVRKRAHEARLAHEANDVRGMRVALQYLRDMKMKGVG